MAGEREAGRPVNKPMSTKRACPAMILPQSVAVRHVNHVDGHKLRDASARQGQESES
jgi:hypothetical protein